MMQTTAPSMSVMSTTTAVFPRKSRVKTAMPVQTIHATQALETAAVHRWTATTAIRVRPTFVIPATVVPAWPSHATTRTTAQWITAIHKPVPAKIHPSNAVTVIHARPTHAIQKLGSASLMPKAATMASIAPTNIAMVRQENASLQLWFAKTPTPARSIVAIKQQVLVSTNPYSAATETNAPTMHALRARVCTTPSTATTTTYARSNSVTRPPVIAKSPVNPATMPVPAPQITAIPFRAIANTKPKIAATMTPVQSIAAMHRPATVCMKP